MSILFYGWETECDDVQHLGPEQEPKQGTVYTMYHGTSVQGARSIVRHGFRQSPDGMLGPGVYVSRDQKKAQRYPLKAFPSDRVVLKLNVDTGRVKRIDKDNHPLQKTWHNQGYDTAWVPPKCGMKAVPSGLEEDCVWDPNRVEIVDVALAPEAVLTELQGLIAQKRQFRGPSPGRSVCRTCKSEAHLAHSEETCWGCGKSICPLMKKHFCKW
ncbi:hypothetical protein Z043_118595 [Scleropages formosus]|uniref:Uncharacterized protein n=1 Tax=Scleropages formosus TaxID=113540 RepID=A0A0P7YAS8_SCLFO|nr:uncharacterized protein LOC108936265 [Scleropages formosus]KPP63162.1 hypothetical protein Z043_118595 [Scleropages formosus]